MPPVDVVDNVPSQEPVQFSSVPPAVTVIPPDVVIVAVEVIEQPPDPITVIVYVPPGKPVKLPVELLWLAGPEMAYV